MTIAFDVGAEALPVSDPAVAPLLMALRDCLCKQTTTTMLGAVCRCYVAWGPSLPVQDACSCDCGDSSEHNGDAWVRLDSLEPDLESSSGGTTTITWCPPPWVATLSLGIYRCVEVPDAEEVLPAETITDRSLGLHADRHALFQVLSCCPDALDNGARVISWVPVDIQGGCAGSYLTVQVPLAGADGCAP